MLPAQVVLTDQEPLIQVLSRNVAANRDRLRAMPVVKHLDWRFAAHRNALAWGYGHFDYILCSDCMYEEDCIDPLIAVLRAMSSPRPASCTSRDPHGPGEDRGPGVVRKPTEIIFTLESRGPGSEEIHRIFFQKVKQWFKVQEITFTCSITEQLVNSDLRAFRLKRQTNASTAGQPPTASAHQSSEPKPKAFSLSCSWAADA